LSANLKRIDVAYVLVVDPGNGKILVVEHTSGGWSLPGGMVEAGETLALAVAPEHVHFFDVGTGHRLV